MGKGVAVFCQVDPDCFHADEKTYFRYTRWRSTRAVAQLLANLGASFAVDSRVFHPLDIQTRNPGFAVGPQRRPIGPASDRPASWFGAGDQPGTGKSADPWVLPPRLSHRFPHGRQSLPLLSVVGLGGALLG